MNEPTFHAGDYVETGLGDRGTIISISDGVDNQVGYKIATIVLDGGTQGDVRVNNLTRINWLRPSPEAIIAKFGGTILLDEHEDTPEYWTAMAEADEAAGRPMAAAEARENAILAEGWDVSLTRPPTSMVAIWQEAVAEGRTTLGYDAWVAGLDNADEDIDRDFEVSLAATFTADNEQHAVAQFIEWASQRGLTYEVREADDMTGEYGNVMYVEAES
jgi:hypothetical protein